MAALNGNTSAVSFQSTNFPDMFLTILPQDGSFAEAGRVGIATSPDPNNASWVVVPGLANPAQYSIKSQVGAGKQYGTYAEWDYGLGLAAGEEVEVSTRDRRY